MEKKSSPTGPKLMRLVGVMLLVVAAMSGYELIAPLFPGALEGAWQDGIFVLFFGTGIAVVVLQLATGIFALVNAKNPQKLKAFIRLNIIILVVYLAHAVIMILAGVLSSQMVLGIAIPGFCIWMASRLKKAYEKSKA